MILNLNGCLFKSADIGISEEIDRLLWITNHKDQCVAGLSDLKNNAGLNRISVLKLIHHNIPEAVSEMLPDKFRILAEDTGSTIDEIIEIKRANLFLGMICCTRKICKDGSELFKEM